jgi:phospholipase C
MSNIKNIVVLVQQNLPFDHFAGGLDYDSSTQTWGNEEQRARHIDENKKLDMT